MQDVTDLDHYDLRIGEQSYANDPNPHMIAAKNKHPWLEKSAFGIFEACASRFPVAVMFGLFGIPRERIEDVKQWLEMLGQSHSLDRAVFPQINESFERLWEFAEGMVRKRKANVDPGEPDVPGRTNGKRFTVLGRGMHICLGQFLARLQMPEVLHLMTQRLKNPRRNGELVWRLFPGVWGSKQLPIAFGAAQAH